MLQFKDWEMPLLTCSVVWTEREVEMQGCLGRCGGRDPGLRRGETLIAAPVPDVVSLLEQINTSVT